MASDAPTHAWCERVTATPTSPVHVRPVGPEGLLTGGGIPQDVTALCGGTIARGWDLTADVPTTFESWARIPQSDPGRVCLPCVDAYRAQTSA